MPSSSVPFLPPKELQLLNMGMGQRLNINTHQRKIKTTKNIVFPSPSFAAKKTITSLEVRCTWHYVKPWYVKTFKILKDK